MTAPDDLHGGLTDHFVESVDADVGADAEVEVDPEVEAEVDPDLLSVCAYWRCGELFERRTCNQRYCRKACRSRQNKWLRAVARRTAR